MIVSSASVAIWVAVHFRPRQFAGIRSPDLHDGLMRTRAYPSWSSFKSAAMAACLDRYARRCTAQEYCNAVGRERLRQAPAERVARPNDLTAESSHRGDHWLAESTCWRR